MTYFVITAKQIFELFLLILLGYISYKKGMVSDEGKRSMTGVLLNLVVPAVILDSFQQQDLSMLPLLLKSIFLSIFIHILLILFSHVIIRKKGNRDYQIERLCMIYSNAGFIGIPLLTALFGAEGAFYASSYLSVFNIFIWTHGVFTVSSELSPGEAMKKLLSPTLIVVLLSMLLFAFQIKLPSVMMEPVGYLAAMNSPFAMIITGISIASCNIMAVFNKRLFLLAFLRQILIPVGLILLFRILGLTDTASVCALVSAFCPMAAVISMFAVQYHLNEELASGAFVLTTLASILTVPGLMLLL